MNSIENDIDNWYEKIKNLQKFSKPPEAKDLQLYKFVYRMTIEDRDRLKLNQVQLKAFSVLDEGIANKLGVTSPAYPIFIADSFTPYNYGGLLNRIK
jgi:hypothetical protein